ncbi:MAG: glycosyltransferase family 2 protein [Myxococcota bacterium]
MSVVTPVYNAERFILETIASVRAQTLEDWEQIVVDDCSTDDSPELIAAQAAKDPRIRVIRHDRNLGVAAARNTAFENARGRYVAFLDSDDMWRPLKLERQVEFMRHGGFAFSYHQYRCIDETGALISPEPLWMPRSTDYESYLGWIGTIGNISVMLDCDQTGPLHLDRDCPTALARADRRRTAISRR